MLGSDMRSILYNPNTQQKMSIRYVRVVVNPLLLPTFWWSVRRVET